MKRTIENYKKAVIENFSFLKRTSSLDDLYAKTIPLDSEGYIIPVCELHANDRTIIEKLAQWRQENSDSFPSQFPVTVEGTAKWLRAQLLDISDRILFLVTDKFGYPIGHLGFANGLNEQCNLEIDNVVRGIKNQNPGIMHLAMKKLLNWAEENIVPKTFSLRVFKDNEQAIKFYQKLGFVNEALIPLKKRVQGQSIFYEACENLDKKNADKYFLHMNYQPKQNVDTSQFISTAGPSISPREVSYAMDAARNGWNNQWNKYINRFESSFSEYLETKHALSTSSCTGALHIALAALGIGAGDEVIVPDITWVATANAVVYVGATPIFADVDLDSWCMDPRSFESLITEKTKAVIPVHLYGHPAPIDKIVEIARKHHLYIIEDAAPSVGAEWKQEKVGTFGDFAAFSFQGAKLAVTGEGGMLITNNDELYEKAKAIWDQGREPNTFWIKQNGLKYKMSNIQAALGLGQLERVEQLIEAKRRIFSWYAAGLEGIQHIKLNYELSDAYSIYWMSSITLDKNLKISSTELRARLKNKNIDTRPVFPAISQYPHWPKAQAPQPNALYIGEQAINLPSGVCLKKDQIDYVCRSIKEILVEA